MSKAREFYVWESQLRPNLLGVIEVVFNSKKQMKLAQDDDGFILFKEVLPDEVSDSMMLDWMISKAECVVNDGNGFFVSGQWSTDDVYDTPRQAILAAMQKEGK